MGKDGVEHSEVNMDVSVSQMLNFDKKQEHLTKQFGVVESNQQSREQLFQKNKEYDLYLKRNIKYIIKIQAWWRGNTGRRLISMLKAKQLGSSKYFTQEEARETVTKRLYDPNQPR
jgi:hypothetical protein